MRSFSSRPSPSGPPAQPATPKKGAGATKPTPPFPTGARGQRGRALIWNAGIEPDHDGTYQLELIFLEDGRRFGGCGRLPYSKVIGELKIQRPSNGGPVSVTSTDLLEHLAAGYDVERETSANLATAPARVAFTVKSSSIKGGGTITLFRYANWLADLGVEVGIYSDDFPPEWTTVNARFHRFPDPAARYAAITEEVVVVYSVLELPHLLQHADTRGKRIFHLCQGAEDFHYGPPPDGGLMAPSGAFDLLNSLPVGRLVVSPHLERYFAQKYGQRSILVPNGIDLDLFTPGPRPPDDGRRTVVCTGNPSHALKGVGVVKAALELLAARRPEWRLHLVNVCGERLAAPPPAGGPNFTGEQRFGLSGVEMRDLFRAADAYVNASWYEGFGLPSLEAMACGLPVVQCDNPGLEGIVEDGRDCLSAKVGSPPSIAAALERIFADQPLRERLRQEGLSTASRNSMERQRQGVAEAFSTLTGADLAARLRPAAGPEAAQFSVLIPVTSPGKAALLGASLQSLRQQAEARWEAIVVCAEADGETVEALARATAEDPRIRSIHRPGVTVGVALTVGLEQATCDRICWLSPGDQLLPDRLALHLHAERVDPGLRFAHVAQRPAAHSTRAPAAAPSTDLQVLRSLQEDPTSAAGLVIDRQALEAAGGFGDGDAATVAQGLWLRVSLRRRHRRLPQEGFSRPAVSRGEEKAARSAAGRATVSFLQSHAFEDLFPLLDLSHGDQAVYALQAALETATVPDGLITPFGGRPQLIESIRQWLWTRAPVPVRATCLAAIRQLAGGPSAPPIREAAARLLDQGVATFEATTG